LPAVAQESHATDHAERSRCKGGTFPTYLTRTYENRRNRMQRLDGITCIHWTAERSGALHQAAAFDLEATSRDLRSGRPDEPGVLEHLQILWQCRRRGLPSRGVAL